MRRLWQIFQDWLRPREVGASAERLAADWLRRKRGLSLVTTNWRNPRDQREELDLVCRDNQVLVFVEVKARSADALVPGYYAVDARKKAVLRRAIRSYLRAMPNPPIVMRFDIVEVTLPPKGTGLRPQVLHFENVRLWGRWSDHRKGG